MSQIFLNKGRLLLLGALASFLLACGGGGSTTTGGGPTTPSSTKEWTIMVYIAGDNSLAEFALDDLNELKAVTANTDVNIVVQMEYKSSYVSSSTNTSGYSGSTAYRGLVTGANTQLFSVGAVNTSNKAALTDFMDFAKYYYPANRYGLVLWSHGGGWRGDKNYRGQQRSNATKGALVDDTSNGIMSMKDIQAGIASSMGATKLEFVAFDACLMSQYEVAYELRNQAKYLVASEELVPGPGMPYTDVMNALTAASSQTSLAFATAMANAFSASYASQAETTMSVTDLSKMDDVHTKMLDFATQAEAAVATQSALLNSARSANTALSFGGTGSQSDSIDLWLYADYIDTNGSGALKTAAAALKTSLTAAVLTNTSTTEDAAATNSMLRAKGMAVYFPFAAANYYATTYIDSLTSNVGVTGKKTWAEFLSTLYPGGGAGQVTGDFSYYITWTNPTGIKVDMDLAVNEPRGNWAAPWIGSTSPNAYLSADSFYSGQNFESYSAATKVETGRYDVFANLYGCEYLSGTGTVPNSSCVTTVTFCQKVGSATSYTCSASNLTPPNPNISFDLNHSILGDLFYSQTLTYWSDVTSNTSNYYDWWYFASRTKAGGLPKALANNPKIKPFKKH